MSKPPFYLTTAITYVNSRPHIGHAYEEIATDVLARWKRATGCDVCFVTGSDEHAANVEAKARELGQTPQAYCDAMAEIFKKTWAQLNISYDRFIRTSEPEHHRAVQEMLRRAFAAGDIYKGHYEGWYCTSCENYYTDAELRDGVCPVHGLAPVWLKEENYFFRLSRFGDVLLAHIEKHPGFIQPETRRHEVVNIIKGGLQDISISRSSTSWGIPFPDDPGHVIYVWFDALINYLTAIGFPGDMEKFQHYWPAEVHVVGKDIIRFHCIIWPAMLLSAALPLPKRVYGHGFLSLKGEKISKTRGNVLDALDLTRDYGVDPVRYVLMAANNFSGDGDFSESVLIERYNSDLANDLGNLLNRTLTMVEKYCHGEIPAPEAASGHDDVHLVETARALFPAFDQAMDKLDFAQALAMTWDLVKKGNKYIEENAPWALFKQNQTARLQTVLYNLLEVLRLVAGVIQPFMPQTTPRILRQLGDPEPERSPAWPQEARWGLLVPGRKIAKADPLFPRLEKKPEPGA